MNKKLFKRKLLGILLIIITILNFFPQKVEAKTIYNRTYSWGTGKTADLKDAIASLPKERVENLKLPILLDVPLTSLRNSWGDKRSGGRRHEGIDIMAPRGSFIISPTKAVVTRIDTGILGGKIVYTANPGNETFYYAHLDGYNPELKVGDILEPGDLIGYVGNSGDARFSSPHLHFTIYDDIKGPRNAYLRIHSEFSYEEKAKSLKKIIALIDKDDQKYDNLKNKYKDLVALAETETISTPKVLGESVPIKQEDSVLGTIAYAEENKIESKVETQPEKTKLNFTRDLKEGMEGSDVAMLQKFLLKEGKGSEAKKLASVTNYGKFGPQTKKALIEYQKSVGITPAQGYFGSKTKSYIEKEN